VRPPLRARTSLRSSDSPRQPVGGANELGAAPYVPELLLESSSPANLHADYAKRGQADIITV
jgi:hypothetical protein